MSWLRADKEPEPSMEQSLLLIPMVDIEEQEQLGPAPVLEVQEPEQLDPAPVMEVQFLEQLQEPEQIPDEEQLPDLQMPQTQNLQLPSTPERLGIQPTRPRSEGFRSRSSRRRSPSPVPSPVRSPRQSLRDRHEAEGSTGSPRGRVRGYRCRNNCSADTTFSTLGSRNHHEAHDCPVTRQVDRINK